ncbi:ABC transporter permease [Chitinophaga eiseniae]|uniref:FtsX-like permease family protein n=1 Tax=Chitinophaga eiseniae TaxID=634771 RepID=A0A847SSF1_9BACT|nr:ABC transporter permease [Chitinophaga eiseniae]NLR80968.1 FtsX-like permease family protein [Chitinophaga eiseniae]
MAAFLYALRNHLPICLRMLQNYLKIALRNLKKDKFYSFINIVGLALATTAFLLIINYARFEYSYENGYKNAADIYRVTLQLYKDAAFIGTDCETHPPLGPLLKRQLPEVVDYVRVENMEEVPEVKADGKIFKMTHVLAADPSLFTIFNFDFIEGSPATALQQAGQAVLTETSAHRLFGNQSAVGKAISDGEMVYTVSAVVKDAAPNTHLKFDLLFSFSSLTARGLNLDTWNANNNYTYVQLLPHASLAAFNDKLRQIAREKIKRNLYIAEPIKDIHLHSHKSFEPEENGDIRTVQFMLAVAALILLVGAVNYINLTTARASDRSRETGMRKALGSSRASLIKQFMTETVLINILATGLALIFIQLLLPVYTRLTGQPVTHGFFHAAFFWWMAAALFLLNCLLAGLYPALVLSGVKPVSVTRKTTTASGNATFRKVLVVGQFAAALMVLSASGIIFQQLSFMQRQDLGLNTSQILVLRSPHGEGKSIDSIRRLQSQGFISQVKQLSQVERVSTSESLPGVSLHELSTFDNIKRYESGEGNGYNFYCYSIDAGFVPLMNIKLLAGHNFRAGQPNLDELILNKEACRLLGFNSPEDALGKKVTLAFHEQPYSTVVGVVDNYHQQSLKGAILPMMHWYNESRGSFFSVKLQTRDIRQTLAKIESYWETQYPGYPFEYHFLDQMYDQQYKADLQFGTLVRIFSLFTLLITCLGILGLTAYNISRRSKEIGIRKVLGASVTSIVGLLSGDFVKLVAIAVAISAPLTWYIMSRWLQGFAFRTQIQWWLFAISGLLTMTIALTTVGLQSVRAALANPVKSLKSE